VTAAAPCGSPVVRQGVFRFADGQWSAPDAVPREPAIVITAQAEGPLWFGYPRNRIARLRAGPCSFLTRLMDSRSANVTAIFAQGKQVWVGGELGFARFDGTRFVPVIDASGNPFTGVFRNRRHERRRPVAECNRRDCACPRRRGRTSDSRPTLSRCDTNTFDSLDGVAWITAAASALAFRAPDDGRSLVVRDERWSGVDRPDSSRP